jgi:hypothetical protein
MFNLRRYTEGSTGAPYLQQQQQHATPVAHANIARDDEGERRFREYQSAYPGGINYSGPSPHVTAAYAPGATGAQQGVTW